MSLLFFCYIALLLNGSENSLEIRFGDGKEVGDGDASQLGNLGVNLLDWSSAFVGLDKERGEWGGTERFDALRRVESALAK